MTSDEIKSYCPNVSDSGSRMVPLPKLRELCLLALSAPLQAGAIPEGMVLKEVERILAADPWLSRLTAKDSPLGIMVELTQRESVSSEAKQASSNCAAHWRDLRRQLALRAVPSGDATRLHAEVLLVLEKLVPDDPAPDSTEGKVLSALAGAVERYEKSRWPVNDAMPRTVTPSVPEGMVPPRAIEIAQTVVNEWASYSFEPDEESDAETLLALSRLLLAACEPKREGA